MENKPNADSMAKLILKLGKLAEKGDPEAQKLMKEIEGFRARTQTIVIERGIAQEKKEMKRKRELSQWVLGINRGKNCEPKILTSSDIALFSKHDVKIGYKNQGGITKMPDLNEMHKIREKALLSKGVEEQSKEFQKLIFPDGRRGSLKVVFDDEGMVYYIQIEIEDLD